MGTFCGYIDLVLGTQLETHIFFLKSDATYWGRPHSHPVCCDQCTFHTLDPKKTLQIPLDGQDHKQIYILFFLIYTEIKSSDSGLNRLCINKIVKVKWW